jgi:tetratricopeptide (TPR) repeat protein
MESSNQPDALPSESDTVLVRVWALGPWLVERAWPDGSWQEIPAARWRQYWFARPLLQRLLCAPERHLDRGTLQEDLWPRLDAETGPERYPVDAAHHLRKVLGQADLLRTEGSHYRLAGQSRLWVDADAAAALLLRAERALQRQAPGEELVSLLQEAEAYFRRGSFLEEQAGQWAWPKRSRLQRQRARCGVWLVRLYAQLGNLEQLEEQSAALLEGGEEQALDIQEETLVALVQGLMEAGYLQQARRCYEMAREQWLRKGWPGSEQMQQAVMRLLTSERAPRLSWRSLALAAPSEPPREGGMVQWTPGTVAGAVQESEEALGQQRVAPGEEGAMALRFGSQTARLVALVLQWKGGPLSELEAQLTQEVQSMALPEEEQGNRLSRRSALLVLAGLPMGLLSAGVGRRVLTRAVLEAELLPACAASLTACWHLLNGTDLALVEQTVSGYLPLLRQWATDAAASTAVRTEAAALAAQGALLLGLVAHHDLQPGRRWAYDQEAVRLSRMVGEPALLVKALTMLGGACFYLGRAQEMLAAYEEAAQLLDQVPPILQSKVQMGLARAYARQGRAREALETMARARDGFPDEPDWLALPPFLAADEGKHFLILFESFVRLELQKHEERREHLVAAAQALAQVERLPPMQAVPERARLGLLNQRALVAVAGGDLEAYTSYALQGAQGLQRFPSQMRRQEWAGHLKQALARWPQEERVRDLLDLLV